MTRRSSSLLLLACALLAAACGGDSTSPGGGSATLALDAAAAMPLEVVTARVRGTVVPSGTFAGTLDSASLTAARLDDSTITFLVPSVGAGTRRLRIDVGGHAYTAQLQVRSAPTVTDPDGYLAGAFGSSSSRLDAMVAGGTIEEGAVAGVRAQLAHWQEQLAAATPAERAQVAAAVAANADALGLTAPGAAQRSSLRAAGAASSLADGACQAQDGTPLDTYEECSAQLDDFLSDHARRARRIAGLGALGLAGAAFGGPVGILTAGVTLALTVNELVVIQKDAWNRFLTPAFARVISWSTGAQRLTMDDGAMAITAGPTFVAGNATPFPVYATYESPTAADASASPVIATAIQALEVIRAAWNAVPAVFGLGTAPTVPASPARSVQARVPAAYLHLGTVGPAPFVGTANVAASDWMLTFGFGGAAAGADHPLSFAVRYAAPGLPERTMTVSATLRPATYAVASVTVTPAQGTVARGGTLSLAAELRDSSGAVVTGQRASWSSSNTARARVDSLGVVTGVDTGAVTITAAVGSAQGSGTLRVAPVAAYHLVDMGTLGGVSTYAQALNDSGWVVGTSINAAGQSHPFLWRDGVMTDLTTRGMPESAMPTAINNRGQIAGWASYADPDFTVHAPFIWENGTATRLTMPTSPDGRFSFSNDFVGLSEDGTVAARLSYGPYANPYGSFATTAMWRVASQPTVLGSYDGSAPWFIPRAMAANGVIVGRQCGNPGGYCYAAKWENGGMVRFETTPTSGAEAFRTDPTGSRALGLTNGIVLFANGTATPVNFTWWNNDPGIIEVLADGSAIGQRDWQIIQWKDGVETVLWSMPENYAPRVGNNRLQFLGAGRFLLTR